MNPKSPSHQWLGLLICLVLVFVAAAVGGLASSSAGSFFMELNRPPWAPPAWLLGPAWTVLYLLMGVASWLVWKQGGFAGARGALTLYGIQLVLNGVWTWLFFVMRSGSLAFVEIVVLWLLILATLIAFWRKSAVAGAMLIPYLLWVAFATALTFSMWQRNPSLL
ncbi:MAG: tryptophan-rich sensory protein [Candidatus Kapabacteria bacterium]|nr:tryptophan-rich sensory protein [Candidatus Kapabacteria bacterium]